MIHKINHHMPVHVHGAVKPVLPKTDHKVKAAAPAMKMAAAPKAKKTEKQYSDRFYDQYVPFKEILDLGLDSRRPEANVPLINLARNEFGVDIEKTVLNDLEKLVKKLHPYKNAEQIRGIINEAKKRAGNSPKAQLKQIVYNKIRRERPEDLQKYFNTVNDAYGKLVVDEYLSNPIRKKMLAKQINQWSVKSAANDIRTSLGNKYSHLREGDLNVFEESLTRCLLSKDSDNFPVTLRNLVFKSKILRNPKVQRTFTDLLMSQFKEQGRTEIFNSKALKNPEFINEVKSRLNNLLMEKLKETQSHYIYQYDGLIEHYAPTTVRGLHDVDDEVVKKLAIEGDYSSVYDIFNNEVSSGARKSLYARGHTGGSNRSTTLNFNIASYFATHHGLMSGTPDNVWFMLYEPQEALYMSDIESAGAWKEAEMVTPHLGAKRFLGAVKFVIDKKQTDSNTIVLKPVDGFLSDKAQSGDFDQAGLVGELKQVFDYAKHFESKAEGTPGVLKVKRRPQSIKSTMTKTQKIALKKLHQQFVERISYYPNKFVRQVLRAEDLPSHQTAYLAERAKQRAFVNRETDEKRLQRLQNEREEHLVWTEDFWNKHKVGRLV